MTKPSVFTPTSLFAMPGRDPGGAVHRKSVEHDSRVGALDEQVGHVLGQVHESDCVPPRVLLSPPVGELGFDRKDERREVGVAHERNRTAR